MAQYFLVPTAKTAICSPAAIFQPDNVPNNHDQLVRVPNRNLEMGKFSWKERQRKVFQSISLSQSSQNLASGMRYFLKLIKICNLRAPIENCLCIFTVYEFIFDSSRSDRTSIFYGSVSDIFSNTHKPIVKIVDQSRVLNSQNV